MNLEMYDNELSRSVRSGLTPMPRTEDTAGGAESGSLDLCKGSLFPQRSVCELCYRKDKAETERTPRKTGGEEWRFRSGRVILRYLYAVYTRDKIM